MQSANILSVAARQAAMAMAATPPPTHASITTGTANVGGTR